MRRDEPRRGTQECVRHVAGPTLCEQPRSVRTRECRVGDSSRRPADERSGLSYSKRHMLSGKKRLLGKVKRLLVLLAAAVASAQSQADYKLVLPKGDKADKYVAKPAADGYAAEILLPAGVEGQPEAFPLDPGLKSVVTVESLAGPDGKPRKAIVI